MASNVNQSAIAEVRDQMSLDHADGSYLNVVGANLGLDRPIFGFTDAHWRAVIKALALDYKQIANKFRDVLAIMFGPRRTQVATLAESSNVGDKIVYLNDTSKLPQVGTLVFDEGIPGFVETKEYFYIDRQSNAVFLSSALEQEHIARSFDAETPIVSAQSTGLKLVGAYTQLFPSTEYPYPVVVGRGTSEEEVALVTDNDPSTGTLTLLTPLVGSHALPAPSVVFSTLSQAYGPGSYFLVLSDTSKFPQEGLLLLAAVDSFTATAGSANSVSVAANTFTAGSKVRYVVVFDGNVTAGLAGVEARVLSNTSAALTFNEDLPATPAAGDTFSVRPVVEFIRNEYDESLLVLRHPILDLEVPSSTKVELLHSNVTVALAPVQAKGAGWDVIQSTPRLVELLIPEDLQDASNVRSASYFHTGEFDPAPSTTVTANIAAGHTGLPFSPYAKGVYTLSGNVSNGNTVTIGSKTYTFQTVLTNVDGNVLIGGSAAASLSNLIAAINLDAGAGTTYAAATTAGDPHIVASPGVGTSMVVHRTLLDASSNTIATTEVGASSSWGASTLLNGFPSVGVVVLDPGGGSEEFVGYYVQEDSTGGLSRPTTYSHLAGVQVDLYQPSYSSTNLLVGDPRVEPWTFSGPYVYDPGSPAPTGTVCLTTLDSLLPGPTKVVLWQDAARTALEVEDAGAFEHTSFPYSVVVGTGTGNREVVVVNDVNLRTRAGTTLSAGASPGDTTLTVVSTTSGGPGDASNFPNSNGYRILIGRGTANEEVAFVTGAGATTLLVEDGLVNSHSIGETVELLADVLSVDPLNDVHVGRIAAIYRSTAVDSRARWPEFTSQDASTAEIVNVQVEELDVASATGLPAADRIILNFGWNRVPERRLLNGALSAGDTSIVLDDSSTLPVGSTFLITVGLGTARQETVEVSANDGVDTLTAPFGLQFAHADGEQVLYSPGSPQALRYSSITGNTLSFSTPAVLESNHYPGELVVASLVDSVPVNTGYGFPLRMPPDLAARLTFLLDLIRAAGVRVNIISQR